MRVILKCGNSEKRKNLGCGGESALKSRIPALNHTECCCLDLGNPWMLFVAFISFVPEQNNVLGDYEWKRVFLPSDSGSFLDSEHSLTAFHIRAVCCGGLGCGCYKADRSGEKYSLQHPGSRIVENAPWRRRR